MVILINLLNLHAKGFAHPAYQQTINLKEVLWAGQKYFNWSFLRRTLVHFYHYGANQSGSKRLQVQPFNG